MYKHILIATDGSELAGKAVAAGLALAKQLDANVSAVTVTQPWTPMASGEAALAFPVEAFEEAAAEDAKRIFGEVSTAANAQGVACDTVRVTDFPAEGIIATAKARGCDLIVMSSHGRRGIARVLLGSQATRVLTLNTGTVLICR